MAVGATFRNPLDYLTMAGAPKSTGTVFNPQQGGYMPALPEQRTPTDQTSMARTADMTRPQFEVSPQGEVFGFDYGSGTWGSRGYANDGGGARATSPRAAGGGGDARGDAALEGLAAEIRNMTPAGPVREERIAVPKSAGTEPYDRRAEGAAYARAKDRTGLAMQSAMRGLQAQMSQRGISGSGIHASAMGDVYEAGLGELGNTDRQLAERSSDRAFTADQADLGRQLSVGTQNAGNNLQAQTTTEGFKQQTQSEKMRLLLSLYSQLY